MSSSSSSSSSLPPTPLLVGSAVTGTLSLVAFLVYRHFTTKNYFARVDPKIPRVPGSEGLLGFVPMMKNDDIYKTFNGFLEDYGSPCVTHLFGGLIFAMGTPEQARDVLTAQASREKGIGGYDTLLGLLGKDSLLTLPYNTWVPLRKTISGVFHVKFMKEYFSVFVSSSRDLVEKIEELSGTRVRYHEAAQAAGMKTEATTALRAIDIDHLTMNFALDVVTKALFSEDMNIQKGNNPEIITKLTRLVHLFLEVVRNPLFPVLHPFKNMEYHRLIRWFHGLSLKFIEARKKDPSIQKSDLLSLMLATTNPDTGKLLTTAEILSQCTTFYFAGHDTTGHTLAWALYEISRCPEAEERIHEELAAVLGDDDFPTLEQANRLTYIQWVVKETLRMHPPVGTVTRRLETESTVGGITIPAGSEIYLNILSVHNSEKTWPEPWKFRPERFSDQESEGRHPYAWMPFSTGERNCVGMNFALLELRTALAAVCKKFLVRPSMVEQPHSRAFITSIPADGIYLSFIKRDSS